MRGVIFCDTVSCIDQNQRCISGNVPCENHCHQENEDSGPQAAWTIGPQKSRKPRSQTVVRICYSSSSWSIKAHRAVIAKVHLFDSLPEACSWVVDIEDKEALPLHQAVRDNACNVHTFFPLSE
jgi:hypothetical protein